jgi:hypothetical protein
VRLPEVQLEDRNIQLMAASSTGPRLRMSESRLWQPNDGIEHEKCLNAKSNAGSGHTTLVTDAMTRLDIVLGLTANDLPKKLRVY